MAATSTLLTLKTMGSGNASAQNKWNVRNSSIESHKPVGAVSSNHQRSKLCSNTALSFGAAVKHPPLALPGNTHIGYSPRPLGLLPHKRKSDMWNELGVLMHSIAAGKGGNTLLSSRLKARKTPSISSETFITTNATPTHGSRPTFSEATVHIAHHNHYSDKVNAPRHIVDDPEYLNTLAQCDMKKYNVQVTSEQHHQTNWPAHQLDTGAMGGHRVLQFHSSTYTSSTVPVKGKKYGRIMNNHLSNKSLEYLSFFGQAQLNKRTLFSDCRNSKEFEPCERCSLRGTRCGHCKAIRTGGGYIILDSLSALDYNLDFNGEGSLGLDSASNTNNHILKSSMSSRRSRRSDSGNNDEINYEETQMVIDEDGFSSNTKRSTARDIRRINVIRDDDTDGPGVGTNDLNQQGIGEYNRGMRESAGIHTDKSKDGPDSMFRDSSSDNYGVRNDGTDILFNGTGNDRDHTDDTKHEAIGSDHLIDRLQQREDSSAGKDGHFNNGGSDTLPESLINDHSQKQTNEQNRIENEGTPHGGNRPVLKKDKYRQKNISNPSRVNFADNDSTIDNELNGGTTTSDNTKSVTGGTGGRSENTNERQGSARYHGDLMKFRSKKDRVRAKSCTLRELKGIDPLDYLAKYCIIDQEKVPHYQRVFENVDMDEDGEINVAELDFALKAVNYNLISDAELLFVNKVLELAGRYALNFQLFTLVAALSEKVVSLEDMVKRLVNEMDFEALETKMKKCKELFYLLANHNDDGEDGVVTTSALGIELQAGGLTEEHVQYVINHLEHEDKGTVEFLDYLVYVPLFVEIHGSINDNPLNFARTK